MKPFPFQKTISSVLIVAYVNVLVPVVPAYALVTAGGQGGGTDPDPGLSSPLPAPVRTPKNVKVNRTAPATVSAPPTELAFSQEPAAAEIFRARVFAEPFVAVGPVAPTPAENRALADAILGYSASEGRSVEMFEQFLQQHPDSAWSASLHLNLGLHYFTTSWFSRAIEHFEATWQATRTATDSRSRALADRAFGEWVQMLARVGRKDTLEEMFQEVGDRPFTGKASELVAGARDGLGLMKSHPEFAYRCGPGALDRIVTRQKGARGFDPVLSQIPSTERGTSLASVAEWAKQVGLDMQLAFREPGAVVPTPAVVHWKLGHFSAIFGHGEQGFLVEDPTFGARLTATTASLDSEATGYFLIPAGELPSGWRSVSPEEAAGVWGKGATNTIDQDNTNPDDPKICTGNPNGMAVASAHLSVVSLNIMDTPLGYAPPVGPAVDFTITYNYREATQPSTADFSNLGSKWVHNWHGFIDETFYAPPPPPGHISSHQIIAKVGTPGGGARTFVSAFMFSQNYTIVFPKAGNSSDLLEKTSATSYTLTHPDGSKLIYGYRTSYPVGVATYYRYHLSEVIDPAGNSVVLGYDGQNRLVSLTDAIGQVGLPRKSGQWIQAVFEVGWFSKATGER